MPAVLREHEVVPGMVVKLRERLPGEDHLATGYAIQTFEDGHVTWAIPDGQSFSSNWEYIDRKFAAVVEAVQMACLVSHSTSCLKVDAAA